MKVGKEMKREKTNNRNNLSRFSTKRYALKEILKEVLKAGRAKLITVGSTKMKKGMKKTKRANIW